MASICGVWLVLLTNGVVANDRLRAEVDLAQTSTISELKESSMNIKGELVRINTKLDKLLGWEYEARREHG